MTDSRLKNHLVMIHIYKEELDETDIKLITNEFIIINQIIRKTIKRNELMLPGGSSMKYVRSSTLVFCPSLSHFAHIFAFGISPPSHYDAYVKALC